MASSPENSLLFLELKAEGGRIVYDTPKMDLDSYIANYDGITRILRLEAIALSSPYFSQDAFRLAIAEAKNGKNVELYLALVEKFEKLAPGHDLASMDMAWVERQTKKVKVETDRLEGELKAYKNNLIKESIRMGQEDLGNHFCATGDFQAAFKAYSKMREYCTTTKQIAQMSFKLLYTSIFQRNWVVAQSYQLKVMAMSITDQEKAQYEPILAACTGLAQLSQGNYREAAVAFLTVDQSYTTPEPQAGILFQREILTPNDVAVYGALCALAKMDRAELQRRVLDNSSFRPILELEPHLRRALSMFCSSKYTGCLGILESYMADYLLDLYLQDHFTNLYRLVRSKCIVQWFSAFSIVTWDEIEKAFPQKLLGMTINDELAGMIRAGELDARLDLVDRLLISPNPDPRITVITDTLAMAERTERALHLKLHRINMQAAGLTVKAPSHTSSLSSISQSYEESNNSNFTVANSVSNMFSRGSGKLKRGSSGLGGFANMI